MTAYELRISDWSSDVCSSDLELGAQRHQPAVDLCPDGTVAQPGVDGIGKVDRSRALGQLVQASLRGEGEDAVLIHGDARIFEEQIGRVPCRERLIKYV